MVKKLLLALCLCIQLHALELVHEGELVSPFKQLLELCGLPSQATPAQAAEFTQEQWRQVGKERWELDDRFNELKSEGLALLREIGCLDPIYAQKMEYEHALVLGGLQSRVQRRLDFLFEEWKRGVRFHTLVFLTGQRAIEPTLENVPDGIESETQMMQYLYRQHPLSQLDIPLVIIDAPRPYLGRRPNTADTVHAWLKAHPVQGSCVAISDQPNVGYQEAVLKGILPPSFSVEVIGTGDEGKLPISLYLDNLARWLCQLNL